MQHKGERAKQQSLTHNKIIYTSKKQPVYKVGLLRNQMSDTITFKIDLKVYLPIQNPLQYLMDPLNLFDNAI